MRNRGLESLLQRGEVLAAVCWPPRPGPLQNVIAFLALGVLPPQNHVPVLRVVFAVLRIVATPIIPVYRKGATKKKKWLGLPGMSDQPMELYAVG